MVTYFNRKDLVSFGSYLMSEKRRNRFIETYNDSAKDGEKSPLSVEESLLMVHHADVENWIDEQKSK
jgi:hypothetical protein